MKKVLSLLLVVAVLFGALVGCGGDAVVESSVEPASVVPEVSVTESSVESSVESVVSSESSADEVVDLTAMTPEEVVVYITDKHDIKLLGHTRIENYYPDLEGSMIVLEASDNLSAEYIRSGMMFDTIEIWEALQIIDYDESVAIGFLFPIKDDYGNYNATTIMLSIISPETLHKINFDGFSYKSIPTISDVFEIHPDFAE